MHPVHLQLCATFGKIRPWYTTVCCPGKTPGLHRRRGKNASSSFSIIGNETSAPSLTLAVLMTPPPVSRGVLPPTQSTHPPVWPGEGSGVRRVWGCYSGARGAHTHTLGGRGELASDLGRAFCRQTVPPPFVVLGVISALAVLLPVAVGAWLASRLYRLAAGCRAPQLPGGVSPGTPDLTVSCTPKRVHRSPYTYTLIQASPLQ